MTNPIFYTLIPNQWTPIATGTFGGTLRKASFNSEYYYVCQDAGSTPAPTARADGTWVEKNDTVLLFAEKKDVYVWGTDTGGKVQWDDGGGYAQKREQNGGVAVNVQDQTTEDISLCMRTILNSGNLLASAVSVDDIEIELTPGHGVVIGNVIDIFEDEKFYQCSVTNVVSNTITVSSPVDRDFTTAALVTIGNINLNASGSQAVPVDAYIGPKNGRWDVTRMIVYMEDSNVMDDSKFGSLAALANGVVLRKEAPVHKNLMNIKTNGDFALESAGDAYYPDKVPAGVYSFRVRRTWTGQEKSGVALRLDSETGDQLRLIIQDDLTGLDKFHIKFQGHIVQE